MRKGRQKDRSRNTAFAPRAIGDGEPEVYTREELKTMIDCAKQYHRGLQKARQSKHWLEQADQFRRRSEIINIFRGLPGHLRRRPTGQATKDAVRARLKNAGLKCSEATLNRDYKELGGATFLKDAVPFEPDEDRSSPLANVKR